MLVKCKKAIENLHYEIEKYKSCNSDLCNQIAQYDQLVTQLQDELSTHQQKLNAKETSTQKDAMALQKQSFEIEQLQKDLVHLDITQKENKEARVRIQDQKEKLIKMEHQVEQLKLENKSLKLQTDTTYKKLDLSQTTVQNLQEKLQQKSLDNSKLKDDKVHQSSQEQML